MSITAGFNRVLVFAVASTLLAVGCVDLEYDELSRAGLLQRTGPPGWTDDNGAQNPQTCQIHNHTLAYSFTLTSEVTGTDACNLLDPDPNAVATCVDAALDAGKAACAQRLVADARGICEGECDRLVPQMQGAHPGLSVTLLACTVRFDDSLFDPSEVAYTFEWVAQGDGTFILETTCYNTAADVPGAPAAPAAPAGDAGVTGGAPQPSGGDAGASDDSDGELPGEDELPPDPNPHNAFICTGTGRTLICPLRDAGAGDGDGGAGAQEVDNGGQDGGTGDTGGGDGGTGSPPLNHLADGGV